jgi:arabinose-5-phosphate isomerase
MIDVLSAAREVLRKESFAILHVMETIGDSFEEAVEMVYRCSGHVVLTGIGKSGFVSRKIASTLSSVGTPALFLHPADSLHGDLGMLQKGDVIIIVSNSGETEEIVKILPWIKRAEISTIVFTGSPKSTIAGYADVVLHINVEEACPYNMVPTSSSTAALALGDALAITVMQKRGFKVEDFANLHPGGTLGRRLLLKVEDLMHSGEALPKVHVNTPMKEAILEITSKRLGVAAVLNDAGELAGVITDGDLRRGMERHDDIMVRSAAEVMTVNPKGIERGAMAVEALQKMERFSITSLIVVERGGERHPVGVIHIHDLLRAKIV